MKILTAAAVAVRDFAKMRWGKFRTLVAWRFMWGNYYGERLRDYPVTVALKLLFARIFFLTQIPLLLPDRHFLVNYYGAKLNLRLFSHPVFMDYALGVYEYSKTRLFRQLMKDKMISLDIGACDGNYSILMAKLTHDEGRILAFEPDPENCRLLEDNVKVNKFKSIEVHQYALSDKEGTATFYPGGGLGSLVSRSLSAGQFQCEPITVRLRKLDDVLDELNIRHVDIIELDVEGSEIQVLKGAEHTLRNNCVHLLMDVDVGSNEERIELYRLLDSFGYEMYRIGKQPTRIKSVEEVLLFSTNVTASAKDSRTSPNGIISSLESRAGAIIPHKLLPTLSSIYYCIRSQNKKPNAVRSIYAVKINSTI
jgi:FkbM family methyltransferase